ncbi:MAG: phosphate propanoyltransferase [Christensenellales bacterium]|jgi:putative phosphotransacetylase
MTNELANIIADVITDVLRAHRPAYSRSDVGGTQNMVPVGISARHVHLSRQDVDALFGEGYVLTYTKPLTQPEQYVTNDFVSLVGPKGTLATIRVLGPERKETQVEISRTDARAIGLEPPVRPSGVLGGSPGAVLRGPAGEIALDFGVIIADRHLHLTVDEAQAYQLSNGDRIRIFVPGDRGGTMENVAVRAGEGNALALHLDTDDGNAFGLSQGQMLRIEKMR